MSNRTQLSATKPDYDADLTIPVLLTDILPRWACLSELRLGDLVKFSDLPKPVTITSSDLEDVHRVFEWMYVDGDGSITEGRGVHDVGQVLPIARAEEIPAAAVRVGNVLLDPDHASPYQLVTEDPFVARPGVLGISWRAGRTPRGPLVVGGLERDPADMLRRAPRGWQQ